MIPGQKVKFLNEKGEGVIRRFINKDLVAVEVEDGFEIPVSVKELVVVGTDLPANNQQKENNDQIIFEPEKIIPEGQPGLFLSFTPNSAFSEVLTVKLINNTRYHFFFTLNGRKGNEFNGLKAGSLSPVSYSEVFETNLQSIVEYQEMVVQGMFFQIGPFSYFPMVEKKIIINKGSLTQINLLKRTPVTKEQSYLFSIIEWSQLKKLTAEMIEESLQSNLLKSKNQESSSFREKRSFKKTNLRINPKTGNFEVDLHIEEITDNYSGLSNAEIVIIQLGECKRAIETALGAGASKIYIIHGVGNGTLKKEVRNLLHSYGYEHLDAPYEKFGAGATEVFLKSVY